MEISNLVIQKTKHDAFKENRDRYKRESFGDGTDRMFSYDAARLDLDAVKDLILAAKAVNEEKLVLSLEAIQKTRAGKFDISVPNFQAFTAMFKSFLQHELIDGWIYVKEDDGQLYPQLVQEIEYHAPYRGEEKPYITLQTTYYGEKGDDIGHTNKTHTFWPKDVSRRKIADALADKGIFHETKELKAAHLSQMEYFKESVEGFFAKQFHLSGEALAVSDGWDDKDSWERVAEEDRSFFKRKVIHNVSGEDWGTISEFDESCLFDGKGQDESGRVPRHPVVAVYDLSTHKNLMVNAEFLTPYKYDKSLREKFILPKTHHDLLNVLTHDFKVLTSDIIEGKSAGNILLAKGPPGVGKTLTAEVYSELIERPLLSVHSGLLGTSPDDIHKNLEKVFKLGKRWDCALLLDEADVFVQKRDKDVEHNAIVAEFLRTLEYFDGLLFMTTNRPDDIDDAVISRCAAIIEYRAPEAEDAKAIWKVMAKQFETELKEPLIKELIHLFPEIVPRDIKMILRLALRMGKAQKRPLAAELFRQCGMFRAVKMNAPNI